MKLLLITLFMCSQALANDVIVGVLDTGIDYYHPMFQNHLILNSEQNLIPQQSNGIFDEQGHGTHVASVIVDYSGAKIFPMKMTTLVPSSNRKLASRGKKEIYIPLQLKMKEAIDLAIKNNIKVLNISAVEPVRDDDVLESIMVAQMHNIIIVAAAGNDRYDVSHSKSGRLSMYPCAYSLEVDNVICAGAYDKVNGKIREYRDGREGSNYGKAVNVFAIGDDVFGAQSAKTVFGTRISNWTTMTGTSQATAKISALIANEIYKRNIKILDLPELGISYSINTNTPYKEIIASFKKTLKYSSSLNSSNKLYYEEKDLCP